MSFSVMGVWEIGYNTPLLEYSEWKHMLLEFGCTQLVMSPISGVEAGIEQTFLRETASIEAELEDLRGTTTLVFVDEGATTDLRDFAHPVNCCYVFGRSSLSPAVYKQNGDLDVKITTVRNAGGFWSHQAAAVVLYDRYLKELV